MLCSCFFDNKISLIVIYNYSAEDSVSHVCAFKITYFLYIFLLSKSHRADHAIF